MHFLLVFNNSSSHQQESFTALSNSLIKSGHTVEYAPIITSTASKTKYDFIVTWGWRRSKQLYNTYKKNILVVERGFLPDRMSTYSLQVNGLNGTAQFPEDNFYKYNKQDYKKRFTDLNLNLPKKIKNKGDYILLIGQVNGDAALDGTDLTQWYNKISRECSEKFKLPVIFRPHPNEIKRGYIRKVNGAINSNNKNLINDLENARLCITYSSNSVFESLLYGVPTIAYNKFSMAYNILPNNIIDFNFDEYLNRKKNINNFLIDCSHKQYSLEELKNNYAIRKYENFFK